ncbi:MAG TPA: hypothetical protein VLL75_14550 [Vicinamibacteria bacterium]|nr:hypothetical protein [Vicinamibacteria bacterium]
MEKMLRLVAAVLVGLATAGLVATALGLMSGALTPWIGALALAAGATLAVVAARACRGTAPVARPSVFDLLALGGLAIVSLRQFLWLTFERDGALFVLLPYNYGDLPLHWTYVEFLARGARFWPENPIFTGERLHYPIGVDLLTALVVQLGVPLRHALAAFGLLGSALLAATLFAWGRGFAVAALLFSGGLVGFEAVGNALAQDVHGPLAWKSLYLALFMPQRGFLFALPAGLILLWSFRERLLRDARGLPGWVEGVVWGSLPLFHAHTFLFVSVVIATWALVARKLTRAWTPLLVALLPALFSIWQVTEGLRAASIVWWKPGWVMGAQNPFAFLAQNFGFFLPLAAWAAFEAWRTRGLEARLLVGPALAFFTLLFFVMLAPWDWDNTKLMLWCYVLVLPPMGAVVSRLSLPLRAGALVLLLYSGVVAVASACWGARAAQIASVEEKAAVCAALRALPPGERIATVQTFNHPAALCGHALVAGYGGHLWSHGIRSKAVEESLGRLMRGEAGWEEWARQLEARYVFWGAEEERAYPGSLQPWAVGPAVAEGAWGRLYALPR